MLNLLKEQDSVQILSHDLKEIIIILEFTSEDRGKENDRYKERTRA